MDLKLIRQCSDCQSKQGHIVLDKVFASKSICWAKEFVMESAVGSEIGLRSAEQCGLALLATSIKIIANFHQKRAPPFERSCANF